jgi:(1->4)-alpha-D-glucan 1-alpha-D-glucosylmutase
VTTAALTPLLSTYRLQLTPDFTLHHAAALVPYLASLGVSHVYASPILRARSGSAHGYDVVDPTVVNPELGGQAALQALTAALRAHGMGLLLDIVPNHMATGHENPYWMDVLAHGRSSYWARWFDIDWLSPDAELRGRVLVPVLGSPLREVIARGELSLAWADGWMEVRYFDHRFPVDPRTAPWLLEFGLDPGSEAARLVAPLVTRLRRLPSRAVANVARREEGWQKARATMLETGRLVEEAPAVRAHVEQALARFTQGPDAPARLRRLLDRQPYRLAYWRRAARELNYRRFFNVDELVALRQEDPVVFAETQATMLAWVSDGTLDGLRVDHVDGLRDPQGYLDRLRTEVDARAAGRTAGAAAATAAVERRFPILVEKILAADERLRATWPVEGTTGYEALNELENVFLEPAGAAEITRRWHHLLHDHTGALAFPRVAYECRRKVLRESLASDVSRLVRLLVPIARREPSVATLDVGVLEEAVVELLAHFPVYRTYVPGTSDGPVTADDLAVVQAAAHAAWEHGTANAAALDFVVGVLVLRDVEARGAVDATDRRRFASRFQQVSGPTAAKGVEDTAFYRYVPLVSRDEVGGEPDRPLDEAVTVLHAASAERRERWPLALVPVSTHDTKRSADARARLDVLSEVPTEWWRQVLRWRRMGAAWRTMVGRRQAPDTNTEYLLYQTLVAVWPTTPEGEGVLPDGDALAELRERVNAYLVKAVREGKSRSTWTRPDEAFERAMAGFVDAALGTPAGAAFRAQLGEFVTRVARAGWWNGLARTVLQVAGPGTPDVYQGDELWCPTLVDPDNRRPVDYSHRAELLARLNERFEAGGEARRALLHELLQRPGDGRLKLHVLARALHARREHPALFRDGIHVPLEARGGAARHVVAAARVLPDGRQAVAVVPRLASRLAGGAPPVGSVWGDTVIPWAGPLKAGPGWRCVLSGGEVQSTASGLVLSELLTRLPVALLVTDRTTG